MTKLINLRVTVPTDDDVTTEDLQRVLLAMLEQIPTQRIGDEGHRIHWAAVDVVRVIDRPAAGLKRPIAKKPGASHQAEMPT